MRTIKNYYSHFKHNIAHISINALSREIINKTWVATKSSPIHTTNGLLCFDATVGSLCAQPAGIIKIQHITVNIKVILPPWRHLHRHESTELVDNLKIYYSSIN